MLEVPAGGAAAAAPQGGALACPSASPHLPVVGAGKPVAVHDRHGRGLRGPTARSAGSAAVGKAQYKGF
jgi:hypothetical protein